MDLQLPREGYQRRQGHPTPVLLPGKSMDREAWKAAVHAVAKSWTRLSDLTFTFHFGEGNGNPLQCSCLENPRDGGAWWAAVYGVAQSRTQLKRLSSSSGREGHASYTALRYKMEVCHNLNTPTV